MTPIELVIYFTLFINKAFALTITVMSVWALILASTASSYAYESAFKRTKGFWVAVTGGCSALSLMMLLMPTTSGLILQLIVATAAGVFMADVRPAVTVRRR